MEGGSERESCGGAWKLEHGKKIRVVTQHGTLYLEVDGRPDGAEAMLPHFLIGKDNPSNDFSEFHLDESDVQGLGEEAFLYRLRREYFFKVGDYERAIRDVNIGIQIIDMITAHADNSEACSFFLQFRPDQEIFKCTAEAKLAIQQKDYLLSRQRLEAAASYVKEFAGRRSEIFPDNWLDDRLGQLKKVFDEIGELWENDMSPLRNSTPTLEQQMEKAIEGERYERAAEIRDMIRMRDALQSE